MRSTRKMKRAAEKRKRVMILVLILFVVVFSLVLLLKRSGAEEPHTEEILPDTELAAVSTGSEYWAVTEAPVVQEYRDPNNYIYPYNTMSADWGAEVYSSGFRYYQIPDEYVRAGGCFPEVVQVYLWCLCEDKGIDYYTMLALIERESNYRYDASGDDGNSKGYMQIQEIWHKDRMLEEGVDDLYNPYGNIRVGLNFMSELYEKYGSLDKALMAYNMGENGARALWEQGVTSTQYTIAIQDRAQELKQEIQE